MSNPNKTLTEKLENLEIENLEIEELVELRKERIKKL